jgi:hypothetical protein
LFHDGETTASSLIASILRAPPEPSVARSRPPQRSLDCGRRLGLPIEHGFLDRRVQRLRGEDLPEVCPSRRRRAWFIGDQSDINAAFPWHAPAPRRYRSRSSAHRQRSGSRARHSRREGHGGGTVYLGATQTATATPQATDETGRIEVSGWPQYASLSADGFTLTGSRSLMLPTPMGNLCPRRCCAALLISYQSQLSPAVLVRPASDHPVQQFFAGAQAAAVLDDHPQAALECLGGQPSEMRRHDDVWQP